MITLLFLSNPFNGETLMHALEIIAQAPLGAIIKFSNGQPKPSARFTRKLAEWEHNNGIGQLTEKRQKHLVGIYHSIPQFTLQMGNYVSNSIELIQFYRVFSENGQFDFRIHAVPDQGSFLILRHNDRIQSVELLHVSASRTDAEQWLTQTGIGTQSFKKFRHSWNPRPQRRSINEIR
ncbi:MAG TPA: hypothetical protein VMU78_09925 [Methylocella sp.]|nr:hypothetical protein [Methylocella sp.]